ncbi:MAG: TonB-dependent receptor [Ignavibacteriales bacterium]|nr:TonB-dependent receptor [Ignavibacteriales bacterium]
MKKTVLLILFAMFGKSFSQQAGIGMLTGEVRDAATKSALPGATVVITELKKGVTADSAGVYKISQVPAGSYSVRVSYIGYKTKSYTDIVLRPARETQMHIALEASQVNMQEVVVNSGYFKGGNSDEISTVGLSYEEIRRSPGSYGDISRVLYGLPSAAKVSDEKNTLMVRGGSPSENSFYVDNIEIPNINHFPVQGTAGGAISFLNIDFINDITFSAGGFSPDYGSRMSSVMDISYREGSKNGTPLQLNLDFSGFGGVAEGSLNGGKITWLASIRRSYLDYLVKAFDSGTSVAPEYGDAQAKISFDINPENKVSVLFITAYDLNKNDNKVALENDMVFYGRQSLQQGALGVTWRKLWGKKGYSVTSVSTNLLGYDEDFYETGTQRFVTKNNSTEKEYVFRSKTHFVQSKSLAFEVTGEVKRLTDNYDNSYDASVNPYGVNAGALTISLAKQYTHGGLGLNTIWKPFDWLTTSGGLRLDYFEEQLSGILQPRLSASVDINPVTTLLFSVGLYAQPLPKILLAQSQAFKNLAIPTALHYIIGVQRLLEDDARLTLEAYLKNYSNLPVDPAQPGLMVLDEAAFRNQSAMVHQYLQSGQKARSYGLELAVQKKMAKDVYGMASVFYGKAEYQDGLGVWRNRSIDNKFILSIEGGYKPGETWELSARWIYAGGRPYTPYNVSESKRLNEEIYDVNRINTERFPAYHSLNIRMDKRWNFTESSITAYISIWNAYNRKNTAGYYWNKAENKQKTLYQFGLLPVFGMEYEL